MESAPVPDPHSSYLQFDKSFTGILFDGIEGFPRFLQALERHAHQFVPAGLLTWLTANYDFVRIEKQSDLCEELAIQISSCDKAMEQIDQDLPLAEVQDTPDFVTYVERCGALMDILKRVNAENHLVYGFQEYPMLIERMGSALTYMRVANLFCPSLFNFACYASRLQVAQFVAVALTRGSAMLAEHGQRAYRGVTRSAQAQQVIWLMVCIEVFKGVTAKRIEFPVDRANLTEFVAGIPRSGYEWVIDNLFIVDVFSLDNDKFYYLLLETCELARSRLECSETQSMLLALAMGTHRRVGGESPVYQLDPNLFSMITQFAFPNFEELQPFAEIRVDLAEAARD